tara:strand:- start:1170 stop:2318 length:1149 start_codon:yes stop_codon:yes gene_type:complete
MLRPQNYAKGFYEINILLKALMRNLFLNTVSIMLYFKNMFKLWNKCGSFEKTLIVKYGNLGDCYILIQQLRKLDEKYLIKTVEIAVSETYIPLLKSKFPKIRIHPLPDLRTQSLKRFFECFSQLKKRNYKRLLLTGGSLSPLREDLLTVFLNAEENIRTYPDLSMGNRITRHISDTFYNTQFYTSLKDERDIINEQLQSAFPNASWKDIGGLAKTKMYDSQTISIYPGASNQLRQWTPDTLANVISLVLETHPNTKILVAGSKSEGPLYGELLTKFADEKIKFKFDNINMLNLEHDISQASLVIANDSAPLHIARYLGINTIVYSGQGHVDRFIGTGEFKLKLLKCANCNWRCNLPMIKRKYACVGNLSRWENLSELKKLLG